MKFGIFGGTFDPPHLGHMILAAEACYQLGTQCVLWVVTADPPHKQNQAITPVDIRVEMVRAAIEGERDFQLSRVDIDRPAPHYAVDTVRLLKAEHPGTEFIYLMGGDSLHDLPAWHAPAAFVQEIDAIGVMQRPGEVFDLNRLEEFLPGVTAKVRFIDAPLLEISSSEIRERASTGAPVRFYLPPGVLEIIQKYQLYHREQTT